jgi:hypothetical protein
MTTLHLMPEPFLNRFAIAGERLRVGGLCEFRKDPEDRRQWKLHHPIQPGGNHHNMFVAPDRGLEFIEAGEQALYVQFFGVWEFPAILRKGEKVSGGDFERGMTFGSPLVSAGDGTGALVHGSRFVNAARICGTATEDLDLTDADADQIVRIRTQVFQGRIAEAG